MENQTDKTMEHEGSMRWQLGSYVSAGGGGGFVLGESPNLQFPGAYSARGTGFLGHIQ